MPRVPRNLTGETFGKLKVIALSPHRNKTGARSWICECECGNERTTTGSALISGNTQSCGCTRRVSNKPSEKAHLLSRCKELSTQWLSVPLVSG